MIEKRQRSVGWSGLVVALSLGLAACGGGGGGGTEATDALVRPTLAAVAVQFIEPRRLVLHPQGDSPYEYADNVDEELKDGVTEFGYCWHLVDDERGGESQYYDPAQCQATSAQDFSLTITDRLKPGARLQAWTYAKLESGKKRFGPGIPADYYPINESPQVSLGSGSTAMFPGYDTVLLAGHWWMAQDLTGTLDARDNTTLPSGLTVSCDVTADEWKVLAPGAPACHRLESGLLLNAAAAVQACPAGWRLPTRLEVEALLDYYDDLQELRPGGAARFDVAGGGLRDNAGEVRGPEVFATWTRELPAAASAMGWILWIQEGGSLDFLLEDAASTEAALKNLDRDGFGVRCVTKGAGEP